MPRYGHEFELSVLTRAIVTIPMNASYPPAARTRMEHYGSFHKQDAIAGVEGQVAIYVNVGGKSAWVIIALSTQDHKYLKIEADGEHPNNLLSLSECP